MIQKQQIVKAFVYDDAGENPKDRPIVHIRDITSLKVQLCICITTGIIGNAYLDHHVKLPSKLDGNYKTGLWNHCAAHCKWGAKVPNGYKYSALGFLDSSSYVKILQKLYEYAMESNLITKYHDTPKEEAKNT